MKNLKSLKFTNKLKEFGPKLKWFLFTEIQDYKLTSEYIDIICPDSSKRISDPLKKMENLVREALIREFSPEIQNSKSFDLLIDMVMHKLQKKSLEKDA